MTDESNSSKERMADARNRTLIITSIITAISTIIVGLLVGFRLPDRVKPEIYEFQVSQKYPFENSPVEIHKGDTVEIVVPAANSTVIDCGVGKTTVVGMIDHEYQPISVLPSANFCSLVGRIGPNTAPYFPVGAYTDFVANLDGVLYLGINDVTPERCAIDDCFPDNMGYVVARVIITRK